MRSQGPRGPIAIACPVTTPNQSLRTRMIWTVWLPVVCASHTPSAFDSAQPLGLLLAFAASWGDNGFLTLRGCGNTLSSK
jgi:hypothetical protein